MMLDKDTEQFMKCFADGMPHTADEVHMKLGKRDRAAITGMILRCAGLRLIAKDFEAVAWRITRAGIDYMSKVKP